MSDKAELVHGITRIQHPFRLPFPFAILLIVIGGYGPALAAVAITAFESGGFGVQRLLWQLVHWRTGVGWYAIAIFGPSLVALIAVGIHVGLTDRTPAHWLLVPPVGRLARLPFGPIGEELGWRGYALPQLQKRWPALSASVWVGGIWFFWHNWPLLTPAGDPDTNPWRLLSFLVYLASASVLMTWVYNSTNGSLLVIVLAHGGLNLAQGLTPIQSVPFPLLPTMFAICALIVTFLNGPNNLTRTRPSEGPHLP